jgi:hypothetical protein
MPRLLLAALVSCFAGAVLLLLPAAVSPLGEESANSNVLCYPFGPTPAAGQLRERAP